MSPHQSIAHYRIVSKLGEGGMGAVYRATDTRLHRDVAIKILPDAFAADAGRMARFQREAHVLASLNHPNIAHLYGVEERALIMELVEGQTLTQCIARGPVPVEEVLPIALQIADAVEYAHERGIIHRDLNPANIKLTPDARVKVLDFGLAKAMSQETGAPSDEAESATLTMQPTMPGMILGTAAYMSPEQARGKPVDKRTDIWAFGVVIYELLTGKRLFARETLSDTIASVVTRDPDWNALPANTPPQLRRLLGRCIRKDLRRRLRDIGEVRLLLEEPEPLAPPAPAPRPRRLLRVAAILAAFFAGIALTTSVLRVRPRPAADPVVARFLVPLPPGTALPANGSLSTQWVPSPDGSNLAMIAEDSSSGITALWIRPLGATSAHRVDRTEDAMFPFWSPDGRQVAFFADRKLKHVTLSDGNVQTVCALPAPSGGGGWAPNGVILFGIAGGPLLRVGASGGVPQPASALATDETQHSSPQFLPGGRHIQYLAEHKDPSENAIYVQELDFGKRAPILKSLTRAMWSPPGHLLFIREGTLFAQPIDPTTFHLQGEPQAIAQNVAVNDSGGRNTFAVSSNGVLAYRSGAPVATRQLTWRDRDGKFLGTIGPTGKILNPSLSPDGKSVAVTMGDPEMDAWVMNLASGVLARLTLDATAPVFYHPLLWSPDSQRLAITRARVGIEEIMFDSGRIVPQNTERLVAEDWTRDGAAILCSLPAELTLLTAVDLTKRRTIANGRYGKMYRLSPDRQNIAYVVEESGVSEIYVSAFPSFAVNRKVSSVPGLFPLWAKGGKELFYRSNDGWMMAIAIQATAGAIEAGVPRPLFKFGSGSALVNRFAVTSDGARFLTSEPVRDDNTEKPAITLVTNWAAELKHP